jgi:hypothetical protein
MAKRPKEELKDEFEMARQRLPTGALLKHSRTGTQYVVLGHSFREHDMEIVGHYAPVDCISLRFNRPIRELRTNYTCISTPDGAEPLGGWF